jgi:Ca-activated chloride channel homolog
MVPMSFQNPLLFLWFLPLAGAIVTLYLLRMRRKDIRVPATFLWPQHVEEIRANSLFQKLRFNWLMVLQLLAALLLCTAFARPQFRQQGLLGDTTVIVLDASASMKATDVTPNRFEVAKSMVRSAIEASKPGDQIALIQAGSTPKVIFSLGNDPSKQKLALTDVQATDVEGRMEEALNLASAIVSSQSSARILVISDGCFNSVDNFSSGKAAVVYQPVGQRQENVGFYALGCAKTAKGIQVYCGVRNYGLNSATPQIDVLADGKRVYSTRLSLSSQKSGGFNCMVPEGTKKVEAKNATLDLLQADNRIATMIETDGQLRVLLVSKGNPFLERALLLDPRVSLDRIDRISETLDTGKFDLTIFDSVSAQRTQSKGVLEFGGEGKKLGQPTVNEIQNVPLTNGVNFRTFYIESLIALNGSGKTLVDSNLGPVVVQKDEKTIQVRFNLLDSDFPLQVGFPIFISNLIDQFAQSDRAASFVANTGSTFSIRSDASITLATPSGVSQKLDPINGMISVRNLDTTGNYEIREQNFRQQVDVILKSETESNIAPKRELSLGQRNVAATQTPFRLQDFWKPILMMCIILLSFEWWYFVRKS